MAWPERSADQSPEHTGEIIRNLKDILKMGKKNKGDLIGKCAPPPYLGVMRGIVSS